MKKVDPSLIPIHDALLAKLPASLRIAITTHINPDGDGFCAALALQRILALQDKLSTIITDDDDLSRFTFLMEGSRVEQYQPEHRNWDLLFVLDCNSIDRLGKRSALLAESQYTILIDHHEVEHNLIAADISYINTHFASVGAILLELFKSFLETVSEPERIHIADCLYATILNDTNNFTNANTTPEVLHQAAELTKMGIKPHLLYQQYFMNHSAEEMRYVGQTLSTIELHCNRRILTFHSTLAMMEYNAISPDGIMNITRHVQGISGLDAIVYFREEATHKFKLSLRSLKLDVNKIAIKYGGGGHRNASGCTMEGSLENIKAVILADFEAALKEHGQSCS